MKISFLPIAEETLQPKIRYVADLFFSTYGLDYRTIQSLDDLLETESSIPDLLLAYGDEGDYQKVKEKIPSGCNLIFICNLFKQVFDTKAPQVKRLKQVGTDFSLPILYASSNLMRECLYLVEEKSGREYPGVVIEKSEAQIRMTCYADLFASSFYFLTLQDEKDVHQKEIGVRFLAKESWRDGEDAIQIPVVNHYFRILFELLQMVAKEMELPLMYKKLWPGGSNLAVALTHDVDILDKWSLYALFRIWSLLKRGDLKALVRMLSRLPGFLLRGNKSIFGIDLILEKEKKRGFNSTFFFLAGTPNMKSILGSDITYSVKKAEKAVQRVLNSQGEVGLHGSFNSFLNKEGLREEKENLDELLPSSCVGIRQHFLYLKVPQTWRFQSESNFLYDCTLGYPDRSGFRSGLALPFQPYDLHTDKEVGIWEINTNVMDQTYDKYDRKGKEQIRKEIGKLLAELEKANGGLLTLLWHTNVLEEFGFPDFLNLYEELLDELSRRKAFVLTGEGIVRFWAARKEVKLVERTVKHNFWVWRYRNESPVAHLTFGLTLPQREKWSLQVEGADASIQKGQTEALITFPKLDRNQNFKISLTGEES
jgi:hypothetical protein